MPYIPGVERRSKLRPESDAHPEDAGDLNFQISCLLNDYMVYHGMNYIRMDDCVGACTNAVHEFQRRVMDPYENLKITINGDVYDKKLVGH